MAGSVDYVAAYDEAKVGDPEDGGAVGVCVAAFDGLEGPFFLQDEFAVL